MKNASPQQRVMLGTLILIIGVLSLVDNLNIFSTRDLLQFWPMAFIALGTLKIVQANNNSGYLIGSALIFVGVAMTLRHLGIIHYSMREFWPVILIAGGLFVIFKDRMSGNKEITGIEGMTDSSTDSKIDVVAVMSGNVGKNSSPDFRGGEITAIMGGVELDLRGASITSEAVLNVFAVWGGISVKVPSDWTVINNGMALMAGIEDKTVPAMNSSKRLIITGHAVMGGVEIKN
jgi:predicted membrane protein